MDTSADDIFWDDIDEALIHRPSGLRYTPKFSVFHKYVSNDSHDFRVLFYAPSADGLPITLNGEGYLGEVNKILLSDQEWDRSFIFIENSLGYHSNLLENFVVKIVEVIDEFT